MVEQCLHNVIKKILKVNVIKLTSSPGLLFDTEFDICLMLCLC